MGDVGGSVYSEVEGGSQLLGYRVEQAGSCAIVLHPAWGSACYPASMVTNADVGSVIREMDKVRRRWEVKVGEGGGGGGVRREEVRGEGEGVRGMGKERKEEGEASGEVESKEGAKEGEEVKALDVNSASAAAVAEGEEAKVIQRWEAHSSSSRHV